MQNTSWDKTSNVLYTLRLVGGSVKKNQQEKRCCVQGVAIRIILDRFGRLFK
jgi:hypothetical protein